MEVAVERDHALADVLGEIADALEIVGRRACAPTISRRSTAIGWRRAMVRIAFSSISRCIASIVASVAITCCGELGVAVGQRVHGVGDLLLGEAAHLGDLAGELLQIGVEGLAV